MAPGSSSGWRTQPGISLLAVKQGTLRVVEAKGCATHEYKAGEVAVLRAGTIHVGNAGSAPVEFVGYFDTLKKNAGRALAEGAEAKAPKGCAAGAAYQAASTGLSATDLAGGIFKAIAPDTGHHHLATTQRLQVPSGGDVTFVSVTLSPWCELRLVPPRPRHRAPHQGQLQHLGGHRHRVRQDRGEPRRGRRLARPPR